MFIMMNLEISIHFIYYSETLTMSVLKPFSDITRDIEVKNNLTIARGEGEGDSGERGFQELL